ncbi:MAG TPA: hypothetical protein VJS89_04335 [Gammaproteobacteria bacterium]|nr:hypothetical protein [Gammaproteobacteria bacterium]
MFTRRIYTYAAVAGILILTVLAYFPGLRGPFVFDDITNIVQNHALAIHSLRWDQLMHAALSSDAGPTRRPLSSLSFALNIYFGGLEPSAFKAVNLAIHLLCGLLFFVLLQQVFGFWHRSGVIASAVAARWLPLLCAGAWLLHPLNVTAVLYVVQRETSLCSLFILLGCVLYCHGRLRLLAGHAGWWWMYLGTAVCGVLALACKETAVLLPVYLLVLEACVFRFDTGRELAGAVVPTAMPNRDGDRRSYAIEPGNRGGDRRSYKMGLGTFYGLFLVLPLGIGLWWLFGLHHGLAFSYASRDYTLGERLLTESRVVWDYIRWTLFPRLPDLGLYHDDIALSTGLMAPVTTLLSILGLVALLAAAAITRNQRPWICFGILWFFTGQLLESTVFPLEIAFEHRNYLADMGVLVAVFGFILTEPSRYLKLPLRAGILVAFTLTFGALTGMRAYIWRSTLSLVQVQAANHPRSPYATYALGEALTNEVLAGEHKLLPAAIEALRHSANLPDSGIIAGAALALLESQTTGNNDPANFAHMAQRLRTRPISASDQQGLVALVQCQNAGNCHFPPSALRALFDAAMANPRLREVPGTYANILTDYGNFLGQGPYKNLKKSRSLMQQAANAVPSEPQYRINVVILDIALQDPDRAERDLQKVRALNRLGNLQATIANLQKEIDDLKQTPHETTNEAPAAATRD